MKTLTILLSALLCFPFVVSAQPVDELLQKVSTALSVGQTDQAISLFGQSLDSHADKSEMYYWTQVDKNTPVSVLFAQKLATYYHQKRSYDKAYLFYRELLQKDPNNVAFLTGYAEIEVCRGQEDKALKTYEKILQLDEYNLAANIFIGNYLYLKAEEEKRQLDADFKKLTAPTKMQYARYRDNLSNVLSTRYNKARIYLQNVIRNFPSAEVQKTLNKIRLVEKEVNR